MISIIIIKIVVISSTSFLSLIAGFFFSITVQTQAKCDDQVLNDLTKL